MQNANGKTEKNPADNFAAFLFALIATSALLVVRGALFYFESWDYTDFLSSWLTQFRGMTFWEGMRMPVGNYNPPYMYILNIISRIPLVDLYLIKIISVIFDLMLAYFVMKLVSLRTESSNLRVLAFLLAFAIPTVILNSSMWAQCDSIYTAFALGSLYYALSGKSKKTFVFFALALSFKLQAAFILPVFAVFVLKKKINLRDCYVFFLVYFAMMLPAVIAGRPITEILMVYFNQSVTYRFLNLNAMNIWQFVEYVEFSHFRLVGLYICGLAVLSLLYFTYVNSERLVKTVDYIRLAFLFAVIMPFLLPQMHDRFFYMADVLALTVFLFDKRRWFIPVITVLCSFIAYAWYLMGWIVVFEYRLAVIALMTAIFIVLRDYVLSLTDKALQPAK
jgi:Gpi18-like mannosyltransferase